MNNPSNTTAFESSEDYHAILAGAPPLQDPSRIQSVAKLFRSHEITTVFELQMKFGFTTVFVPVKQGDRNPLVTGFPDFTAENMKVREYLLQLKQSNVAILTGPNSGNLISVDLDDDEKAQEFLNLNRELCEKTIQTTGSRGCNYWFRINGDYPEGMHKINDADGGAIGELRAGRCITVVKGTHPSGDDYEINGQSVINCSFRDIVWPDNWSLPWESKPEEDLFQKEGDLFVGGNQGRITFNEPAIVEKFTREHLVLHDPGLGFYEYESSTGAWDSFVSGLQNLRSFIDQLESKISGLGSSKGKLDTNG